MMLRTLCRMRTAVPAVSAAAPSTRRFQHTFSVKGIHRFFPASIAYYSPKSRFSLYDCQEYEDRPHDMYDNGVIVDSYGIVYPGVQDPETGLTNGAVMYAVKSFMAQENIRQYYDEFLDLQDTDESGQPPHIYTIPKGTIIPNHLILINTYLSHFTLQPSAGMTIKDLNQSLDKFFAKYGTKETVEGWLEQNPYPSAIPDEDEEAWSQT